LALLCACGTARSEPFEKERCDALVEEHGKLVAGGVPEVVRKGPQWAAENASPERLAEARRFLALEEALLFRCGHAKLRAAPPAPPEGEAAKGGPGAATAAAAGAVAGAGVAAAAKAKSGSGSKARAARPATAAEGKAQRPRPAKGAPAEPASADAKAKPKPKPKASPRPKAKADDAYRPPAKTSGVTN
jgi:hypothetical protein